MLLQAKTLPDQALDCIPSYRLVYLFFGNGKPQSWVLPDAPAHQNCQVCIAKALVFLENLLKLSGTNQPQLSVKRLATGR